MGKKIAFENGRISNCQGFVTLTLDRVILHVVMHHSLTSTYSPNFIEIEETFLDGRTEFDGRTFETHFITSTPKSRPKKLAHTYKEANETHQGITTYVTNKNVRTSAPHRRRGSSPPYTWTKMWPWPLTSKISPGDEWKLVAISCKFHQDCSSSSWNVVFTGFDLDSLLWPWSLTSRI